MEEEFVATLGTRDEFQRVEKERQTHLMEIESLLGSYGQQVSHVSVSV